MTNDFLLPIMLLHSEFITCLQEIVAGSMNGFQAAFSAHVKNNEKQNVAKAPDKRTKARAASKVQGQAALRFNEAFLGFLGLDLFPQQVPDLGLEVSHIGVQAGSVTGASEKGWVSSLRFSSTGTKSFVCISAEKMNTLIPDKSPVTFWETLSHPEKCNCEDALLEASYVATVGPHEVAYLPAGWVFVESIMDDCDLLGVAFRGHVVRNTEAYNQIQLIRKLYAHHGRADDHLEAFVSFVGKASLQDEQEPGAGKSQNGGNENASAESPDGGAANPETVTAKAPGAPVEDSQDEKAKLETSVKADAVPSGQQEADKQKAAMAQLG